MSDDVRTRARRNMDRMNIPKGTDDPLLLALGATPLPETKRWVLTPDGWRHVVDTGTDPDA